MKRTVNYCRYFIEFILNTIFIKRGLRFEGGKLFKCFIIVLLNCILVNAYVKIYSIYVCTVCMKRERATWVVTFNLITLSFLTNHTYVSLNFTFNHHILYFLLKLIYFIIIIASSQWNAAIFYLNHVQKYQARHMIKQMINVNHWKTCFWTYFA